LELFCLLVSDLLDQFEYENQILPQYIHPLDKNLKIVVWARTMLNVGIDEKPKKIKINMD
jgi:hypothetical protein